MAKRPPKRMWNRETLKLQQGHTWRAKPGYKIFVADRGAVRFDFPADWLVLPQDDGSIKFCDRPPPDDDCTLQVSVFHLPPEVDWSGLPLGKLLRDLHEKQDQKDGADKAADGGAEAGGDESPPSVFFKGEVIDASRTGMELFWAETRFIDTKEDRPARSHMALARGSFVQPLITFAFWEDHAAQALVVWDEVLRTLRLGEYVQDPTLGNSPWN